MSLFDRYVQVKTLSNQEALNRQNQALLQATATQNAHLAMLQNQVAIANKQQEQLLRYQEAQHAAREQQKFLKDAAFTVNEILNYIESIEDPVTQFAVLISCYATVRKLLTQITDQLEEIHDKVAASKLQEKLSQIKARLGNSEKQFQDSEIGKYLSAKANHDEAAEPLLIELDRLAGSSGKPVLSNEIASEIKKATGNDLQDPASDSGKKAVDLYGLATEAQASKRAKIFKIALYAWPVIFITSVMMQDLVVVLFLLTCALPVLGIRSLLANNRRKRFVSETEKFYAAHNNWIVTNTTGQKRKAEIAQSLQKIAAQYPHEALAEKMLARYPNILSQMATPSQKLASLFEKWGVED